ncbi:MAG: hypothetical protein HC773_03290 [Scytonema sp. CRU_2_7]|nr:hypothetical protein [Scytonema sp. CRU_2_7]
MNFHKQRRKRGVILTAQGFEKLEQAKSHAESWENRYKSYTLEALSDRTGLDPDTLMKVFACNVGVDKRTLSRCFRAFNLQLEASDYYPPQREKTISTQYLSPIPLKRQKSDKTQNRLGSSTGCLCFFWTHSRSGSANTMDTTRAL